jgi:hypothetical protein
MFVRSVPKMVLTLVVLTTLGAVILLCSCAKTQKSQIRVVSINGGEPFQSDVRYTGEVDDPWDDSFYEDEVSVVIENQMGAGLSMDQEYVAHITSYRVTFTWVYPDTGEDTTQVDTINIPVREGALNLEIAPGSENQEIGAFVLVRAVDKRDILCPMLSYVDSVIAEIDTTSVPWDTLWSYSYVQDERSAIAKIEFEGYEEITNAPLYTVGMLDVHFADWYPDNPEGQGP